MDHITLDHSLLIGVEEDLCFGLMSRQQQPALFSLYVTLGQTFMQQHLQFRHVHPSRIKLLNSLGTSFLNLIFLPLFFTAITTLFFFSLFQVQVQAQVQDVVGKPSSLLLSIA